MDIYENLYIANTEEIYLRISESLESKGYCWIFKDTNDAEKKANWAQYKQDTVILTTVEDKKILYCHINHLNPEAKARVEVFMDSINRVLPKLPSGLASFI